MLRSLRLGDMVVHSIGVLRGVASRGVLVAALVALMSVVFAPLAASAQDDGWAPPETVWVEETGQIVDKTFLSTWRSNQIYLGNPISPELRERVKLEGVKTDERSIQYFQNGVLVATYDDKRGDDWNVRALPLGEQALELDAKRLKDVKLAKRGSCEGFSDDDCRYFKSTNHTVKLGFKGYWDTFKGEQLLGAPLTEEFVAADGWTTQYFENGVLLWKKDKGVVPRAIGKEAAAREKVKTKAVKQPDDVPTYAEALFSPPVVVTTPVGPGPIQGGYKEIVISISQQYMWAYEDGVTITETYVSTGTAEVPETTTPIGYWSIHTKFDSQTMEGTISNEYYLVPDVPWVMYFDWAGNAIHGAYWHNSFGTPMSHGCVNLPLDVASFLYSWAEIGTLVTVIE
jgi:lipoprotein-anchoring transpeptidase ErfK/SrfK